MKKWLSNMTTNKWIIFALWIVFSLLLVIVVILASITTSVPQLRTDWGKFAISFLGFLFFLSLLAAVLATVIIGYVEKRKAKKGVR